MDMPTSTSLQRHPPNITTHCGKQQQPWRKTHRARKPNTRATPIAPPPPCYNLQWTTHSQGHMQNILDLLTPSKPPHAHAATHFAPPNIYCGSAPSSINNTLTTQSTLMGTPFHILPYTTHTPTNSYLSSKTAVPCNALLILDPQWK
jgi:hypothetical protein